MKGYDFYRYDLRVEDLLQYAYHQKLYLYRINKKTFYSTYQSRKKFNEHPQIHYQYSVGIMGMLFRLNIDKIISLILSCIILYGLSNTIFSIEIIGESLKHKQMLSENLNDFKVPFFYNEINIHKKLFELNDSLNWYEVKRKGSKLQIHYLPRLNQIVNHNHTYNLIAEKEGVVAFFDVRKGNKLVQLNQKVNKGDVLVSNIMIDSRSNEKTTEVIGSVYAYTFHKVEIELDNKYPIGIGYYIALLKSRMTLNLDEDEKIVKEISLHFEEDFDTIRISNYYVLYERISIVGDFNG